MTHWGWYWKIKIKHKPKSLCPSYFCLDSFSLFKIKGSFEACINKVSLEMPPYKLKATLLYDKYSVEYSGGKYEIPIEKQSCNYGGSRYFLHCPKCNLRMRFLYCKDGLFACRRCLKIGYFTQRLRPSIRCIIMESKYVNKIKLMGGDNYKKPPRMKSVRYDLLRERCRNYENKFENAVRKELLEWYPKKREDLLNFL
ncbi:MAG: hypothetical protein WC192_05245 [Candidatus Babeliales bacterium]